MNGASDLRICREQTEVGINARRGGIVVAGSNVSVTANPVGVAAHEQRKLAVGLQSNQAVKDLHAGIFQIARPADVVSLIEARF